MVVHKNSSPLGSSASIKSKITISLKPPLLPLICFSFSAFVPEEKVNYDFFSLKFSVKIYRYVPYGYLVVLDSVSF